MLSPTAVHRDKQIYFIARWTLRWGPAWDWKGSTYVEAQHQTANGRPKVNRATRQERADPHGQFTGTEDYIARCYLN